MWGIALKNREIKFFVRIEHSSRKCAGVGQKTYGFIGH